MVGNLRTRTSPTFSVRQPTMTPSASGGYRRELLQPPAEDYAWPSGRACRRSSVASKNASAFRLWSLVGESVVAARAYATVGTRKPVSEIAWESGFRERFGISAAPTDSSTDTHLRNSAGIDGLSRTGNSFGFWQRPRAESALVLPKTFSS